MELHEAVEAIRSLDRDPIDGYDYEIRQRAVENLVDFVEGQESKFHELLYRWAEAIYNSPQVKSELLGKIPGTARKIFCLHLKNANLNEEEIELAIELLREKGYQL
jgi:hypothetical protein